MLLLLVFILRLIITIVIIVIPLPKVMVSATFLRASRLGERVAVEGGRVKQRVRAARVKIVVLGGQPELAPPQRILALSTVLIRILLGRGQ